MIFSAEFKAATEIKTADWLTSSETLQSFPDCLSRPKLRNWRLGLGLSCVNFSIKRLTALAILAAAGTAFAQSSVTVFGTVDANLRSVTSGDNKFMGMAQDGATSSRIGFRGVEDLGGGLRANFHMEGALNPDTGTAGGFNFMRQSTVGVAGGFGEVRLGRDLTPMFRLNGIVDPFGFIGVGGSANMFGSTVIAESLGNSGALGAQDAQDGTSTFTTTDRGTERRTDASGLRAGALTTPRITFADPNGVRASNSFAYYTPNFNGFTASLMYSAGAENTNGLKNVGKMTSGSVNYTKGPLVLAAATQATKGGVTAAAASFVGSGTTANTAVAATNGTGDMKWTTNYLAGSYDLKVVKLSLGHRTEKLSEGGETFGKLKSTIYGVSAPIGAITLRASYITKKADLTDVTEGSIKAGNQFAVGAVYELSKRTALYGTYSQLKNENGFANSIGSAVASAGGVTSKGYEFGVRHNF